MTLQVQEEINLYLHRMEDASFTGHPPSLTRNLEYGIDDHGNTVVPTPRLEYTPYGISLFLPNYEGNHLYPRSSLQGGFCYQFVKRYRLPEGLGIVNDGPITLKYWNANADKKERRAGRTFEHQHYSLVCIKSMPEAEFLAKLTTAFQMPHVFPCRVRAAAELQILKKAPKGLDGPVSLIFEACSEFYDLAPPMQKFDIAALQNHIDAETPSFNDLMNRPLWARTAFHLLGRYGEISPSQSSAIRYINVREKIAKTCGYDADSEYGEVVLPTMLREKIEQSSEEDKYRALPK